MTRTELEQALSGLAELVSQAPARRDKAIKIIAAILKHDQEQRNTIARALGWARQCAHRDLLPHQHLGCPAEPALSEGA